MCAFPGVCGLPALSQGPGSACLCAGQARGLEGRSMGFRGIHPQLISCLHTPSPPLPAQAVWLGSICPHARRSRQPGRGRRPADSAMAREREGSETLPELAHQATPVLPPALWPRVAPSTGCAWCREDPRGARQAADAVEATGAGGGWRSRRSTVSSQAVSSVLS